MTLKTFDRTLQETNEWLESLEMEMGWDDRPFAYKVLRAVLHVLRDRLTPEEAVNLGAQLPMLIRGFYYEGWDIAKAPVILRDKNLFLNNISDKLDGGTTLGKQIDAERLSRAVFKLLTHRLSSGEVDGIRSQLPGEIEALWPHNPASSG